jgi:RNA polymerase sigma-70 factor (ECF subfamily)
LDALGERMRRARPIELSPQATLDTPLTALPATRWIEPIPDIQALPSDEDPAQLAVQKQSIRLAFVAALQHLPPRQRAALLLTEVLGWAAAEVAESLETSVPAVNSALQRARATLGERELDSLRAPLSNESAQLVDRFVDAFERYDMDAFTQLLRNDAVLSMPPYSLWVQGPERIRPWMLGPGAPCRGSRLVRVNACGSPAFGQYRPAAAFGKDDGGHYPWALIVLEPSGEKIATLTYFLDTASWFPRFGLPLALPARR